FEIPGEKPKTAVKRAGWLEAIFANVRILAGAAAACAVLAVVTGLGFYFLKPADRNLNAVVTPVTIPDKKADIAEKQEPEPIQSTPKPTISEKKTVAATKHQFTPVPVVVRTRKPRVADT